MSTFEIWKLPDVLLYQISEFIAPPTERSTFFCHKMAVLNKASYKSILEEEKSVLLWDLVLAGDYGVSSNRQGKRRTSKRLKRCPVDQARDAHKLLKDNTEIAYFYLCELSSTSTGANLTRSKLRGILDEYGPHLMINKIVSSGGAFLVEVCRARKVNKITILHCVQELVERRGALVNLRTKESSNSSLTALCVAAVRGLPKVVHYLLSKEARPDIPSSASFRLSTNSRKSLRCVGTPLEFANAMLDAEKAQGATNQELADLQRCIKLLTKNS
jgi:hypothetical protein